MDERNLTIFTNTFLQTLDRRDRDGRTVAEAEFAGPWQVAGTKGEFSVFHESLGTEERIAKFSCQETALLVSAVLPVLGRESPYAALSSDRESGALLFVMSETGPEVVGWLRSAHPDLCLALHIAESFLRSPRAMACLLEAAGFEVLNRAGRLVQNKIRIRQSREQGNTD